MAKNDKFQLLNLIESGDFEEACRRILDARLNFHDIQPVTKADKFCIDDAPDELRKKLSRIQADDLDQQGGYSDQVMTVVDTLHCHRGNNISGRQGLAWPTHWTYWTHWTRGQLQCSPGLYTAQFPPKR